MAYRDYVVETARQFVDLMDRGYPPWQPQYSRDRDRSLLPANAVTGKPYSGRNIGRLWMAATAQGYSSGRWLTYRQARSAGGQIRRGEKGVPIVFWTDERRRKDPETGEMVAEKAERPMMRVFHVFNVDQADSLPAALTATPMSAVPSVEDRWAKADHLLERTGAKIEPTPVKPSYSAIHDTIFMPPRSAYPSEDAYVNTLAHELAHWTGAGKRLGRQSGWRRPGTAAYAQEELVAEIGATLICDRIGAGKDPERSLAYMASWTPDTRKQFLARPERVTEIFENAWRAHEYVVEGRELERIAAAKEKENETESAGTGLGNRVAIRIPYSEAPDARKAARKAGGELTWNQAARTWEVLGMKDKHLPATLRKYLAPGMEAGALAEGVPDRAAASRRVYLDIPFGRKDEAKARARAAGMPLQWDSAAKGWWTWKSDLRDEFRDFLPRTPAAGATKSFAASWQRATTEAGAREVPATPVTDGRWHRLPAEDDKNDQKSIAYRATADGVPGGIVVNHRTGDRIPFRGEDRSLSAAEIRALRLVRKNRIGIEAAERKQAARAAAIAAEEKFRMAKPPERDHAYIEKKGISIDALGENVRQDVAGDLLAAVRNIDGRLRSLQTIRPDGEKRFLPDGEISGNCIPFGKPENGQPIIIAEGVATAATLRAATGKPVLAALHAGNLTPVASAASTRFPKSPVVIAADNDHENPHSNIGLKSAREAAESIGATVVAPHFGSDGKGRSDFNDLADAMGSGAVRSAIAPALEKAQREKRMKKPRTRSVEEEAER